MGVTAGKPHVPIKVRRQVKDEATNHAVWYPASNKALEDERQDARQHDVLAATPVGDADEVDKATAVIPMSLHAHVSVCHHHCSQSFATASPNGRSKPMVRMESSSGVRIYIYSFSLRRCMCSAAESAPYSFRILEICRGAMLCVNAKNALRSQ